MNPTTTQEWKIDEHSWEEMLHYIPSQGPIKDFIHHNTLHAFQSEPFDQAVLRASRLLGARSRLSADEFSEALADGRIKGVSALPTEPAPTPAGWVASGIRVPGFAAFGVDILQRTRSPLIRLLSNYLDQGVAAHSHVRFEGFWDWLRHFFIGSHFNFECIGHPWVQEMLTLDADSVIEASLRELLVSPADRERYILEILLGHPGWSGLVHQVEVRPEGLFDPKKIRIQEVVALEIAMDVAISKGIRNFQKFEPKGLPAFPSQISVEESTAEKNLRGMHEALEWTFYQKKISKILDLAKNPLPPRGRKVQVFFCIDDRECSMRRHLESLDDGISTYGAAGFFGLDCKVLEAGYPYSVQSCPVILTPKVLIEEEFIETAGDPKSRHPSHHHHELSRTFTHPIKGWLHSLWRGAQISMDMVGQVFSPETEIASHPTRLRIDFRGERDGIRLGYTKPEMADRVFSVLRNCGLQREFARLVVMVGHESTSNNNPHYAAYDCGACSGRTGAQNARAFAMMANDPEVKKLLLVKGLHLPEDVHFIGAVHNTTRDEITYFDLQDLPDGLRGVFDDFSEKFEKALTLNAKERSRKFELFPQDSGPSEALEHVRMRSVALFEPRPELNHATNAMCVVGRRSLTAGASFDRRSFLHSYDPSTDPEGLVLSGILNAVVPVCGGINLEYYFSRLDNEVYGAGTKLPHNVVGLFGVSNGVVGDLRTGLPSQMIEVHDPIRLLILVEQSPEVALAAVARNPATFEWVQNQWVHYACFDPAQQKVLHWNAGEWKEVRT